MQNVVNPERRKLSCIGILEQPVPTFHKGISQLVGELMIRIGGGGVVEIASQYNGVWRFFDAYREFRHLFGSQNKGFT